MYALFFIQNKQGGVISTIFQSGNSQAVRIPKALQLAGKKVEAHKVGEALIIHSVPDSWKTVFANLSHFKDFMPESRQDSLPQARDQ